MRVHSRSELIALGHNDIELRHRLRAGELRRVSAGIYQEGEGSDEELHRHLMSREEGILGLESAALLHGLPLAHVPELLQVIEHRTGKRIRGYRSFTGGRIDRDIVSVNGLRCTSVARTLVDLARLRPMMSALIPWEAALWRDRTRDGDRTALEPGPLRTEIDEVLEASRRFKGVAKARALHKDASAFSESPMETRSRIVIRRLALPEPQQQFPVADHDGEIIGFTDFGWPDLGVLGEYDGEGKYDELARPGETARDVLRREKWRQERMEAMGWVIARWGKEEIAAPQKLRRLILQHFERARRRAAA